MIKIAVASDDARTVSASFGTARQYMVVTLDEGVITHRETRPKVADARPAGEAQGARDPRDHFAGHRVGQGPRSRYDEMAAEIGDCEAVLASEFGVGARNALMGYGIEPVQTKVQDAEEAALAYARGAGHPRTVHPTDGGG